MVAPSGSAIPGRRLTSTRAANLIGRAPYQSAKPAPGDPLVGGRVARPRWPRPRRRRQRGRGRPLVPVLVASAQSRSGCLSKAGGAFPGTTWSAGQSREESGVTTSSHRRQHAVDVAQLELGVGQDEPGRRPPARPPGRRGPGTCRGPPRRPRRPPGRRPRRSRCSRRGPRSALVDGVNSGSGEAVGQPQPGRQRRAVDGAAGRVLASRPGRPGSPARCTRWWSISARRTSIGPGRRVAQARPAAGHQAGRWLGRVGASPGGRAPGRPARRTR